MVTGVHLIEAALLKMWLSACALLPIDSASWLGGFLGRAIGPCLGAHHTAQKNLAYIFPKMPDSERQAILAGMWDNLGRVGAELAHLSKEALARRVTVTGLEHLPPPDTPLLFVSGHLGNWELMPVMAAKHGRPLTLVYRQANNPFVDEMIARLRGAYAGNMFPKGPQGAIKMARAIKNNESLGMLVDQKMNDGIAVPFFGIEAMTAPAVAQLALRYRMPIMPVHIVRLQGACFECIVDPPLTYETTGNDERDALTIMTVINQRLESWIRAHPEQWFWVHKRWPKEIIR